MLLFSPRPAHRMLHFMRLQSQNYLWPSWAGRDFLYDSKHSKNAAGSQHLDRRSTYHSLNLMRDQDCVWLLVSLWTFLLWDQSLTWMKMTITCKCLLHRAVKKECSTNAARGQLHFQHSWQVFPFNVFKRYQRHWWLFMCAGSDMLYEPLLQGFCTFAELCAGLWDLGAYGLCLLTTLVPTSPGPTSYSVSLALLLTTGVTNDWTPQNTTLPDPSGITDTRHCFAYLHVHNNIKQKHEDSLNFYFN